jgi:general stress protein 26
MTTPETLTAKFWAALHDDRSIMIGLVGVDDGHTRPMTAITEAEHGPIWLFTTRDATLVTQMSSDTRAIASFVSKGHDLFASVHGRLVMSNDAAIIDRLWNPAIAAWYDGGKADPNLALLRFDAENAEIWLNENSFLDGVKLLFGGDPKRDAEKLVATVTL